MRRRIFYYCLLLPAYTAYLAEVLILPLLVYLLLIRPLFTGVLQ